MINKIIRLYQSTLIDRCLLHWIWSIDRWCWTNIIYCWCFRWKCLEINFELISKIKDTRTIKFGTHFDAVVNTLAMDLYLLNWPNWKDFSEKNSKIEKSNANLYHFIRFYFEVIHHAQRLDYKYRKMSTYIWLKITFFRKYSQVFYSNLWKTFNKNEIFWLVNLRTNENLWSTRIRFYYTVEKIQQAKINEMKNFIIQNVFVFWQDNRIHIFNDPKIEKRMNENIF